MLILGSCGLNYDGNRSEIDKLIEDKTGNVLIIPLACMFESETGGKEKFYAEKLGFKKENIYVFDSASPQEFMERDYSLIVVMGGNTFKLLYMVRKYNLDSFIRQQVSKGADYFGASAGAYLACPNINYVKLFDDNNYIAESDIGKEEFNALGLTDKYVLCHFDIRGVEEIKMCNELIGGSPDIITIRETQLVVL